MTVVVACVLVVCVKYWFTKVTTPVTVVVVVWYPSQNYRFACFFSVKTANYSWRWTQQYVKASPKNFVKVEQKGCFPRLAHSPATNANKKSCPTVRRTTNMRENVALMKFNEHHQQNRTRHRQLSVIHQICTCQLDNRACIHRYSCVRLWIRLLRSRIKRREMSKSRFLRQTQANHRRQRITVHNSDCGSFLSA